MGVGKAKAEYLHGDAFSVVNKNGNVISWGNINTGGDNSLVSTNLKDVSEIFSNKVAFAALKNDGSVVTWGLAEAGGDSSEVKDLINRDVINIYSSAASFLAVKKDGSIVTWGVKEAGANSNDIDFSAGIQEIISANSSYAVLLKNGSVVTWGKPSFFVDFDNGKDIPIDVIEAQSNVKQIVSSDFAYAALKNDGSVFTWGGEKSGGDLSSFRNELSEGVSYIHSAKGSFMAIKENGKIIIWSGDKEKEYEYQLNDLSISDIEKIYSSETAYAILFKDGSVRSYGDAKDGGDINDPEYGIASGKSLESGVVSITPSLIGFAALKTDNTVVNWGSNRLFEGSPLLNGSVSNIKNIYANMTAYAVLKNDGSVVTWGSSVDGGDSSKVKDSLSSDVVEIFPNRGSFAALKSDGSVITWGDSADGGDSSNVSEFLDKDILSFADISTNYQIDPSRPAIIGPSGKKNQDSETVVVEEDNSTIFTFTSDETVTWTITGGSDSSAFSIDKEGKLILNSPPDYESPNDLDKDNRYEVTIVAEDISELKTSQKLMVEIENVVDTGSVVAFLNSEYEANIKGFSSINGSAPINVNSYEIGKETTLELIKDFGGSLHAGDTLEATPYSYKYQGILDINGDNHFDAIFTNRISRRWVTSKIDSRTGQVDFDDNGSGGGTRVVGIYEDPLIAIGDSNGGFLLDGINLAPANYGVPDSERYVDLDGNGIIGPGEDRLALNSQVRFQNDLEIDNLEVRHSGDYDSDGIHEVYWKTADGTAYLRALMHDDGNIRYANYQSEVQMENYLTGHGHTEIIKDII